MAQTEKDWTAEEIRELTAIAKRKGITKKVLAQEWLGITPNTLSDWIDTGTERRKQPSLPLRKLLSCVEPKIARLKDVPQKARR